MNLTSLPPSKSLSSQVKSFSQWPQEEWNPLRWDSEMLPCLAFLFQTRTVITKPEQFKLKSCKKKKNVTQQKCRLTWIFVLSQQIIKFSETFSQKSKTLTLNLSTTWLISLIISLQSLRCSDWKNIADQCYTPQNLRIWELQVSFVFILFWTYSVYSVSTMPAAFRQKKESFVIHAIIILMPAVCQTLPADGSPECGTPNKINNRPNIACLLGIDLERYAASYGDITF